MNEPRRYDTAALRVRGVFVVSFVVNFTYAMVVAVKDMITGAESELSVAVPARDRKGRRAFYSFRSNVSGTKSGNLKSSI